MINSPPSDPVLHLTKHAWTYADGDYLDVARCELFASVLVRLLTSGIIMDDKTYYLCWPLIVIDSGDREIFGKMKVRKRRQCNCIHSQNAILLTPFPL